MRNRLLLASRGDEQGAARIRARLRSGGLDVETLEVDQATGADVYAGLVLGGTIDMGPRSIARSGNAARAA